jgi:hypothetical protein
MRAEVDDVRSLNKRGAFRFGVNLGQLLAAMAAQWGQVISLDKIQRDFSSVAHFIHLHSSPEFIHMLKNLRRRSMLQIN